MEAYFDPSADRPEEDILELLKKNKVVVLMVFLEHGLVFEIFSHSETVAEHARENQDHWLLQGKKSPEAPYHFKVRDRTLEEFQYELNSL